MNKDELIKHANTWMNAETLQRIIDKANGEGKTKGYNLGRLHGKIAGLKMAFEGIPGTHCCDVYSEWLEQQIQDLENEKPNQ